MPFHGPHRTRIYASKRARFPGPAFADARLRGFLVALPALEECADKAGKARTVHIEISFKGIQEKRLFLALRNVGVTEVETVLPVGIGQGKFGFRQ